MHMAILIKAVTVQCLRQYNFGCLNQLMWCGSTPVLIVRILTLTRLQMVERCLQVVCLPAVRVDGGLKN